MASKKSVEAPARLKRGTPVAVLVDEHWLPGKVLEVRQVPVGFCPIVVELDDTRSHYHTKVGPDFRVL